MAVCGRRMPFLWCRMNVRPPITPDEYQTLAVLLRRRVETIADRDRHVRDPDGHFQAIKAVSEAILAAQAGLEGRLPVRLKHFLDNCSYEKALIFIENELKG